MFSKEALQHLTDHSTPFVDVSAKDSKSQLLAHPSSVSISSLERFQPRPNRISQALSLASVASFCEYIERFGCGDTSIFLDVERGHFHAALDYHGQGAPRWVQHKAVFNPQVSLQWRKWYGIHNNPINQVALAHFIEANINDIVEPEPGQVLLAALDFQANEKLALGSSMSLDDGSVKFSFTKDNVVKNVTFPHRIRIEIPIYENEGKTSLEVRIRYKLDGDGALVFIVSLVRDPLSILRAELLDIAQIIREDCAGKHVYEGNLGR